MSIRARLQRLEKVTPKSGRHYLFVRARHGESQDEAIQRCLDEKGISMDDVGHIWAIGGFGSVAIDNGGYERLEDLIGWREAGKALDQLIESCKGSTPQDMIQRREQRYDYQETS